VVITVLALVQAKEEVVVVEVLRLKWESVGPTMERWRTRSRVDGDIGESRYGWLIREYRIAWKVREGG